MGQVLKFNRETQAELTFHAILALKHMYQTIYVPNFFLGFLKGMNKSRGK